MAKSDKDTTEAEERKAFEADKKRREDAGVPYKIAEQLARRQQKINADKKGSK